MVGRHAGNHAFTDGLSRRARENVTPCGDPFELPELAEAPVEHTPEHVAARMVEAFETLGALRLTVGPRRHANGWPTILQEFSDLTDADAMAHAREVFARARKRPSAEAIARMDEALAWPLRYGRGNPIGSDAVLVWAWCKAWRLSLARLLRNRAARAKGLAAIQTRAENARRKGVLATERERIQAWAERLVEERRIADRTGQDRVEGLARIKAAALARHDDVTRDLKPVTVLPHEAMPEKVLSRSSLDRHLSAGLRTLAQELNGARFPVR